MTITTRTGGRIGGYYMSVFTWTGEGWIVGDDDKRSAPYYLPDLRRHLADAYTEIL